MLVNSRYRPGSVWVLGVILAIAFATAAAQADPSYLNLGFEDGFGTICSGLPLDWQPESTYGCQPTCYDLTTATSVQGQWSFHLAPPADGTWDKGGVRQVSEYNTVTGGEWYMAEAWIHTANVQNPAGWYVFGIEGWADNTRIADSKMSPQEKLNYDWRLVRIAAEIPSGLGINRLGLWLTRHTDGDAWYDAINVQKIPALPYVLKNPYLSYSYTIPVGGTVSTTESLDIRNGGAGTLNYTIQNIPSWITVTPNSGSSAARANATVDFNNVHTTISYNTASVPPGHHVVSMVIDDPAASNSETIDVDLIVSPKADFDQDADVDVADFAQFAYCFSGATVAPPPGCTEEDLDGDSDVDVADFAHFSQCFSGPEQDPPPTCP